MSTTASASATLPFGPDRGAVPAGHGAAAHTVGAGTLLALELRRTRPLLAGVFGIALGVAVLGLAASHLESIPLVSTLGRAGLILAGVSLTPVVLLLLAVDYWRSVHGATAYLTHMVPAPGSLQYGVRLAHAAVVGSLAAAVSAAILVVGMVLGPADARRGWEEEVLPGLRWMADTGLLALLVALVVFSVVANLVQLFFAASIGSEQRLGRFGAGGPVLAWVGLYLVNQVVSLVAILAVPFGIGPRYGARDEIVGFGVERVNWLGAMASNASPGLMPVGLIVALGLVTLACLVRTVISWNRRITVR